MSLAPDPQDLADRLSETRWHTIEVVESTVSTNADLMARAATEGTAEVAGVKDVTVALPRLVGGEGVLDTFPQPL
ncbi:MAG TPA: hypothetical protein PLC22_15550, partial [Gordonia sp. (in: high G+C Gram-positive bacteria)]|nr:hypothetical protein [Gordonia sp. (in: high G+C Gram-positive bacteria)]